VEAEVGMMQPKWQHLLDLINRGIHGNAHWDVLPWETILEIAETRMQTEFPGPYRLELTVQDNLPTAHLIFTDEESEIEWRLRWS
jgi:hypothetical protein